MDLTEGRSDRHLGTQLGVVTALLDGDASLAFHQVLDLLSAGTPFDEILFDVLVPIQTDVGRRWVEGDYGIGDEHAVSAALETVVALLAGSFDQPEDGTHIVISAAEGDTHSLPSKVIAAYLTFRGFRVTNLGATLPAEELQESLELHRPAALILTCTMAGNLPGARQCIAAAHRAGVPVVAGGRGFGSDDRRARRLGADAWLSNPRLLDGLLGRWEPKIEEAEAAAADLDEANLSDRWADVGAIAEAVASAHDLTKTQLAALRIDVNMFVATLDASILVEDSQPLIEVADWHRAYVVAGDRPSTTDSILNQLTEVLGAVDPRVVPHVAGALEGTGAQPG
ncbi:MAG: cobalamin-dependent protein [Acidimicrobiia bacterium]|nr:cobalamin-dependent protein [Acidimicrobiia bacterium]